MAIIHLIQQGKGGVGKSMIGAILFQVLKAAGKEVHAYDTDPINATLAGYSEFNTTAIEIMRGSNIDKAKFDILWEQHVMKLPPQAHAIVDNGASSFVALSAYLETSDAFNILEKEGHTVDLHTVITGGQAIQDTLKGFGIICKYFSEVPKVVWLNPFFGDVTLAGKQFEDFELYQDNSDQVAALIKLPTVDDSALSQNLEELFARRHSFEAGINSPSLGIMSRSRLKKHWNVLFDLISQAPFIVGASSSFTVSDEMDDTE
ncbi:MAG: conjugal transfer protein TraL [Treponema sp.]|jgi:anion-transporting  ArsA/GET3 family ATPase|nr:conjugal transfer protein TraL [Treponema sp.]